MHLYPQFTSLTTIRQCPTMSYRTTMFCNASVLQCPTTRPCSAMRILQCPTTRLCSAVRVFYNVLPHDYVLQCDSVLTYVMGGTHGKELSHCNRQQFARHRLPFKGPLSDRASSRAYKREKISDKIQPPAQFDPVST